MGLFEDPGYHEESHDLEAGDVLVLYTDGITEGRRDGEQFGEARLEDAVRRHVGGDAPLADAILAEALDYQGGRDRRRRRRRHHHHQLTTVRR